MLLSEVERIEGAAAREAQRRGWDLDEIKDLMRRMLAEARTLRAADSTLCNLEAAHHAACVGDLAGEAFELQDGTRDWSAKGCPDFWKELNWELQAFRKVNTKLELYPMQTVERQARSPRDSGWIIISPSIQRRAAGRAAGEECRPALSL